MVSINIYIDDSGKPHPKDGSQGFGFGALILNDKGRNLLESSFIDLKAQFDLPEHLKNNFKMNQYLEDTDVQYVEQHIESGKQFEKWLRDLLEHKLDYEEFYVEGIDKQWYELWRFYKDIHIAMDSIDKTDEKRFLYEREIRLKEVQKNRRGTLYMENLTDGSSSAINPEISDYCEFLFRIISSAISSACFMDGNDSEELVVYYDRLNENKEAFEALRLPKLYTEGGAREGIINSMKKLTFNPTKKELCLPNKINVVETDAISTPLIQVIHNIIYLCTKEEKLLRKHNRNISKLLHLDMWALRYPKLFSNNVKYLGDINIDLRLLYKESASGV